MGSPSPPQDREHWPCGLWRAVTSAVTSLCREVQKGPRSERKKGNALYGHKTHGQGQGDPLHRLPKRYISTVLGQGACPVTQWMAGVLHCGLLFDFHIKSKTRCPAFRDLSAQSRPLEPTCDPPPGQLAIAPASGCVLSPRPPPFSLPSALKIH